MKEMLEQQKEQKSLIESEIREEAAEEFRCQAELWKAERNKLQFLLQVFFVTLNSTTAS